MAESDSKPYGLIYLVTNKANGKVYIGQTICTIAARWKGHCNAGKGSRLWLAIEAHGRAAFSVEKIDEASTKQELDDLECFYIAAYRSNDKQIGYNFERGGAGKPKTKDAVERVTAQLRGRTLPLAQREKIAATKRGVKHTQEHIANMIAAKIGYKHSEEAKAKMSAASMGKTMPTFSQEHREKLSAASKAMWEKRRLNTN
jgi:group I intron endonuclease